MNHRRLLAARWLDAIRQIISQPGFSGAGGWFVLEHGWQQAAEVRDCLSPQACVA